MKSDIEIARSKKMQKIEVIAEKLHIKPANLIKYGDYKAKIDIKPKQKQGKLILVTAINPTKAGNGKTTVSIGLADAFALKNKSVCLALREPSLGPVFGMKGGATGGGYSQVVPMEDINLHFNGDFHAITSANNLLCANIDNSIFQGNPLDIDPDTVMFNRCMDMNDRALRDFTINSSYQRKEKFNITAASEIMAIMCLATDIVDLKERLGGIMVALNYKGQPVYARDLKVEDAMAILLKDALKPKLVQTLAGTPAIVHLGPFANIAHGCNSIIATRTSMSLAKYTITEAGFGSDLGAEKFLDVKCRIAGLKPDCVVLVATIPALKLHGGAKDDPTLRTENLEKLKAGIPHLIKHIKNMTEIYKVPTVVTLNKYVTDTKKEIELVKKLVAPYANVVVNNVWGLGGKGALELADEVIKKCNEENNFTFAYDLEDKIEEKIQKIVTKIYGGKCAQYSDKAKEKLKIIKKLHLEHYPVIIAKTQFSLTDNKNIMGAPTDFEVYVNDLEIKTGSRFIVAICGSMMLMTGLSAHPASEQMTIDENGKINGIY